MLGLLVGALRGLSIFAAAEGKLGLRSNEPPLQSFLLGLGALGLLALGLFPQAAQPFLASLPAMFEHLGR
jgi:hypothetical protein